jgi:hypothetical protein
MRNSEPNSASMIATRQTTFERWKANMKAEPLARKRFLGWNHEDWLEVLGSLRISQYWPMEEATVGHHAEVMRASAWVAESDGLLYGGGKACRIQ